MYATLSASAFAGTRELLRTSVPYAWAPPFFVITLLVISSGDRSLLRLFILPRTSWSRSASHEFLLSPVSVAHFCGLQLRFTAHAMLDEGSAEAGDSWIMFQPDPSGPVIL